MPFRSRSKPIMSLGVGLPEGESRLYVVVVTRLDTHPFGPDSLRNALHHRPPASQDMPY